MTTAMVRPKRKTVNVGATERKASLVGGAVLAGTGLASLMRKRFFPGIAMLAAGTALAYRGKTGHCDMYGALGISTAGKGIDIEKTISVMKPRHEVYEYWRHLENLPRFMEHIESVRETGQGQSHWKASGPGGTTMEWDAEIAEDVPDRKVSWRTTGKSDIEHQGWVEFADAPGGKGTEVKVHLSYRPPGGAIGKTAAAAGNIAGAQMVEEDLKRFKQVLETGEVATAAMN